jgi:hypothetical protein
MNPSTELTHQEQVDNLFELMLSSTSSSSRNLMLLEEFMTLTGKEISAITASDKSVWSRYFNGKQHIGERTLVRHAKALGMLPDVLLQGIRLRREATSGQTDL